MARNSDTQASVPMSESSQQRVADRLRGVRLPAFAEHVGIEVIEAARDRVVGRIVVGPQHSNGRDRVHGGAIMSLADTLGAIGTILNLPAGAATTTIESKTNFLAAGRGPHLVGEATPLHIGRNTMVWQTTIRDGDARRIAVVTQTQLVIVPDQQPPSASGG
jgi:1,4-dihydroxy-2-naphthoyl-CoA hydrolase